MRVLIEVPDGSHLQLLADALAEAADMRTRAAGRAARDVAGDAAIADKRPDASRLLQVVADADWIRTVAEQLPLLVVEDAPPAASPAAAVGPGSVTVPPAAAETSAERVRAAGRGRDLELPADQAEALRRLTVPPGARLTPGAVVVEDPGPPPELLRAAAAREAAEQALADIAEFGDG